MVDRGRSSSITPQSDGLGNVQIVHHFHNEKIGALGIAEVEPDVYSFATFHRGSLATNPPPGTGQVWSFNLSGFNGTEVPVTSVSNLTESIFPSGMTASRHEPRNLLLADSQKSVVWRIDPATGVYDVSTNDTLLVNTTSTLLGLGVNDLHVKNDFVYSTNSQQNLFGRYPISTSGLQCGPIEILKKLTFTGVDDFTVFPGLFDAAIMATDPMNGTLFQYQSCTKRLANTNGTTANKVAWSQMAANGSVPVFVASEGGFEAYESFASPIKVVGALSVFEMELRGVLGGCCEGV
jgi:hypothetical protein